MVRDIDDNEENPGKETHAHLYSLMVGLWKTLYRDSNLVVEYVFTLNQTLGSIPQFLIVFPKGYL